MQNLGVTGGIHLQWMHILLQSCMWIHPFVAYISSNTQMFVLLMGMKHIFHQLQHVC
jgi:hypothetical protein